MRLALHHRKRTLHPVQLRILGLFAWLIGKPYDLAFLPQALQDFERYKREGGLLPKVPFQMLTAQSLDHSAWAMLVCLDIQPYATTQAPEREDILNIGGFSDAVFGMIELFAKGELHPDHWVGLIERQEGIAA